ncbi:MAG: hypothetical protein ABH867_04345 [Patescibacteria group bacterium]
MDIVLVGLEKRKDEEVEEIFGIIEGGIRKSEKFFEIPCFHFKINFLSSRNELNQELGRKTPSWLVAHGNSKRTEIAILAPWVFEKESSHLTNSFPKILFHEIAHLFTSQVYPFLEPLWLIEGLAYFIAEQKYKVKLISDDLLSCNFLELISSYEKWQKMVTKGAYGISYFWVDFLIKSFGKKNLLVLVRKMAVELGKFENLFNETYPIRLSLVKEKFITKLRKTKGGGEKNDSRK